jgi:hypothetical protein
MSKKDLRNSKNKPLRLGKKLNLTPKRLALFLTNSRANQIDKKFLGEIILVF